MEMVISNLGILLQEAKPMLMGVVIALLSAMALFFILFKLRALWAVESSTSKIKGLFFILIIAVTVLLFVILGALYWKQTHAAIEPIQTSSKLLYTTRWAKSPFEIYFIEDDGLYAIQVNGENKRRVLQTNELIREYQFSPDGRYLLVVTYKSLYLVNPKTGQNILIERLHLDGDEVSQRGVINGVRWAPKSEQFCYGVSRWSRFSSQNAYYIYQLEEAKKLRLKTPARRLSSLYWDQTGENLYYLRYQANDTNYHATAFDIKIYRLSVKTLSPILVNTIPSQTDDVPLEGLELRNIDLFLDGKQWIFTRDQQLDQLVSARGDRVAIDAQDFLSLWNVNGNVRRLFKVNRHEVMSTAPRYQYRGGDLTLKSIRWLPDDRYVLLVHKYLGPLILDPEKGKLGILIGATAHGLGWY